MPIKTLHEKFIHELGDAYDAEHRFLEAMQEMMGQAQESTVKMMLQEHIEQTQQQIKNLEQVYQTIGEKPKRISCDGAAGIVTEAQKLMKQASGNQAILDTAIAGAWAKGEHYEIATYQGLISGAQQMGHTEAVDLLRQNLQQEQQIAQRLEQSTPQLLQQAMTAQERGR